MIPTIEATFPSGATRTIHPLRMLVQTQNAEMKARHGMFLPGVGKLHPTVRALRDEYEIPARTWAEAAVQMRRLYEDMQTHIETVLDEQRIAAEMEAAELRGITAPDY